MKKLVVASNMLNEISQLENCPGGSWFDNMIQIADGGILVVDGGSTDGTIEFLESKANEGLHVVTIIDNIIQTEGYGQARNHLRACSRQAFPDAEWMIFLDSDERIHPDDYHRLRWIKDYLTDDYDMVALPRIDWLDIEMKEMAKDWRENPDWQARMSRLSSPVRYFRRLHEQTEGFKQMHTVMSSPKINHFHRSAGQEKRDFIGKICSLLHSQDEYGDTYPEHPKEAHYRELLEKEGL